MHSCYASTSSAVYDDSSYHQNQPSNHERPLSRQPDREAPRRSPPPIKVPSAEYQQLSLEKSTFIANPSSKKLLILDLNGTLLVRGAHKPPKSWRRHGPYDPYADPKAVRPLRPVHPRPFMPSFTEFLFHQKTKEWMDTMVWSSAQQPNVDNMVQVCFHEKSQELVAIWARDTLGLSENDYNRKAQTTKDLAKPWAAIFPKFNNPTDDSESSKDPVNVHSALNTFLLDDSPSKASLQPWNHVCIPEYLVQTRIRDLATATYENKVLRAAIKEEPSTQTENPLSDETSPANAEVAPEQSKKRRKKDKKNKKVKAGEAQGDATELDASPPVPDEPPQYDETLLAVIGVLVALKHESNVAAWIRAGGLWAGHAPEDNSLPLVVDESSDMELASEDESPAEKRRRVDSSRLPSSSPQPPPSSLPPSSTPEKLPEPQVELQWFSHPPTISHWIAQGRQALVDLDIKLDPGIITTD
ncbi:hypothetical protein C8J56DRAFT_773659 [Mycena floridula]|nr:hypothetical protein C8J56DRAFT_773659 [Mycena floridula]